MKNNPKPKPRSPIGPTHSACRTIHPQPENRNTKQIRQLTSREIQIRLHYLYRKTTEIKVRGMHATLDSWIDQLDKDGIKNNHCEGGRAASSISHRPIETLSIGRSVRSRATKTK